jgi:hypothetical protein
MVDYAAVVLAESAPLMLTPGRRCENGQPVPIDDPEWIKFTIELAEAGKAAYKASQTRNQQTISDALRSRIRASTVTASIATDEGEGRPNARNRKGVRPHISVPE